LQRAAAAVVTLCEHYRPKMMKRAVAAEKTRESGILGSSSASATHRSSVHGGFSSMKGNPYDNVADEDEEYILEPEEDLKRAQLLDTMYLFALMNCSPVRRAAVIDLLSGPNRCQIESCSVLLASHGNQFTEALLWLFRSQNQHSRVLQALTEDKCVAIGKNRLKIRIFNPNRLSHTFFF
jgi:hypothetical protein